MSYGPSHRATSWMQVVILEWAAPRV